MVDGDNGYGDVKNIVHVLHTYERLGAGAIMFEDQVAPKRCGHIAGKDVIPSAEMEAKIRAVTQNRLNPDTFILARTRRARRARARRGLPPRREISRGRRRRHLHRVAARRGRVGADRKEV